MTNRRNFIKLSIAATALAPVAYLGYQAMLPFQKTIQNILIKDLAGLKVKSEDIDKFAAQAAQENPWGFSGSKVKFISFYNSIHNQWLPLPFKYKYEQYRADIVGRFLLSTDFFINKMNESKDITYIGIIYSPYKTPCSNPFSAAYYPS